MRLLVTGGRDFDDVDFIAHWLGRIHKAHNISHLIHGAARGVDSICAAWAEEVGVEPVPYPVENWRPNGILDKSQGHKRNARMLDEGKPDIAIAFPGGRGTKNMVEQIPPWIELWQSERVFFTKESDEHGFCSNFAREFDFTDDDGVHWKSSEHYYQAKKAYRPEDEEYVRNAPTPFQSKKRVNEILVRADIDHVKRDVMREALRYKFADGSPGRELLMNTGMDYLIEYAPWGDVYWGVDRGHQGQNWLGKLLMEQRDGYRYEQTQA